jgi:hypothetical protein
MRLLPIGTLACAGCQLLFPLQADEATEQDGGTSDSPNVEFIVLTDPVLAGTPANLALTITGEENRDVFYRLTTTAGAFDVDESAVTLSSIGAATQTVTWEPPPTYQLATVTAETAYDATLVPASSVSQPLRVLQQIGASATGSAVNQPFEHQIIAYPITLPMAGELVGLGIRFGDGNTGNAIAGLYSSTTRGAPFQVKVATLPFPMPTAATVLEPAIASVELPAGDYWIAIIASGPIILDGQVSGPALLSGDVGSLQLPDEFPPAQVLGVTVGLYATIAPAP